MYKSLSVFRFLLTAVAVVMMTSCAAVITAVDDDGMEENRSRRSVGATIDDSGIETMIKVNLNVADEQLKRSHIKVNSHNGVVLLVGQVPSQDLKNLATRVATSSNSRVKTVHNELEVAGVTTILSRTNDAWISSKLKTRMLANSEISGWRTKVITENGVVYLMGLVTQEEAEKIVDMASHTRGVTKVVRAFEYIN
jgi:osmotically-inducible protein OsmY